MALEFLYSTSLLKDRLYMGLNHSTIRAPDFPRGRLINLESPSIREIPEMREDGRFHASGLSQVREDAGSMASERGSMGLPSHAASANSMFAHSAEQGNLAMGFPDFPTTGARPDNFHFDPASLNSGLFFSKGSAHLRLDVTGDFDLADNRDVRSRELQPNIEGAGFVFPRSRSVPKDFPTPILQDW